MLWTHKKDGAYSVCVFLLEAFILKLGTRQEDILTWLFWLDSSSNWYGLLWGQRISFTVCGTFKCIYNLFIGKSSPLCIPISMTIVFLYYSFPGNFIIIIKIFIYFLYSIWLIEKPLLFLDFLLDISFPFSLISRKKYWETIQLFT